MEKATEPGITKNDWIKRGTRSLIAELVRVTAEFLISQEFSIQTLYI
ncbi:hypothetical protein [Bacillus sp. B1-b2]|nr:hypothetical protein [Bacillus sp. B1-b2]